MPPSEIPPRVANAAETSGRMSSHGNFIARRATNLLHTDARSELCSIGRERDNVDTKHDADDMICYFDPSPCFTRSVNGIVAFVTVASNDHVIS